MKKEMRTMVSEGELCIEAYRLEGIAQPFPNHFHEYYVIGFMEEGKRVLDCKNREYTIKKGDILLFNPGDSHACTRGDGGTLDYRGFNISREVMLALAEKATGRRKLPGFSQNVLLDKEAACYLRPLHERVMKGSLDSGKRGEELLILVSLLIRQYDQRFESCPLGCREEVERACAFMEQQYAQRICLDQLCRCAGLSRSALLRAFVRAKGVTPYRYLENIRISRAKKLLGQGVSPAQATLLTGFFDQSHFTNCFTRFIGLAPGAYRDMFKDGEKLPHGG